MKKEKQKKAWVVTVRMGYGHERASYPLESIANERIITANSDKIISKREKKIWISSRKFYEWVSRIRAMPYIGEFLWNLYDKLQSISPVYPFRDLSNPTFQVLYMHRLIKKGLGKSLVDYVKTKDIPFITTFFIPALAASFYKIKNVYCIVTDTDINRGWVQKNPKKNRITYLAPCETAARRLRLYGICDKNIFVTGFPLPKENLGGVKLPILRKDIGNRLPNLDPREVYLREYQMHIKRHLGKKYWKKKSSHPLTITFAVGGAGAQKRLGIEALKSLKNKILQGSLRMNLVAGVRLEVSEFFKKAIESIGLKKQIGKGINILCALSKNTYFSKFNSLLHETDILWTKPSELVFYTALGIPIIIAPPIGAHEVFNQKWLTNIGSGFTQENPKYANEWIFDWLESGRLAEAAWEGFMEAPKYGTYNIERVVFKNKKLLQ